MDKSIFDDIFNENLLNECLNDTCTKIEDIFNVVEEPEYSKSILLDLQDKYYIDTLTFLSNYREGSNLQINNDDIDKWLFNYNVFMIANGDINDLINGFFTKKYTEDDFINQYLFDNAKIGQAKIKEEASIASSFIFRYYFVSERVIVSLLGLQIISFISRPLFG